MPRSVMMGWETIKLSNAVMNPNQGLIARAFGPSGADTPVHSVQIGLKIGNSAANPLGQTGRVVALIAGWFHPNVNFGSGPPSNSDWGSAPVDYNPNGYEISGTPGQGWGFGDFPDSSKAGICVFDFTMECQLPNADPYRDQIFLPPGTVISQGSYFVIRIGMLTIPKNILIDFESQGVIFYG